MFVSTAPVVEKPRFSHSSINRLQRNLPMECNYTDLLLRSNHVESRVRRRSSGPIAHVLKTRTLDESAAISSKVVDWTRICK
jgi:hypothetical protein